MKIVGGNFGVRGSAFISRDGYLVIEGAQRAVYSAERTASISASVVREKKFGALGFILGAILLSVLFGFLLCWASRSPWSWRWPGRSTPTRPTWSSCASTTTRQ